jgi:hypothetical protein
VKTLDIYAAEGIIASCYGCSARGAFFLPRTISSIIRNQTMADQIVAPQVHASGNEQETRTDGRAHFVAPAVQDLGKLQTLTQLQFSI